MAADDGPRHHSRSIRIVEDLGTVRLVDLDPLRVDAWLARVIDVIDTPGQSTVVHLDVVGVPDALIDELHPPA